jgi:hypothetical protein
MMKKVITILIIYALASCGATHKLNKLQDSIIGTWCLVENQTNYPTITFRADALATFDSRIDTVYSFKYSIDGKYLNLVQPDTSISRNRILTLSKDSLVFETLLENKTKQTYYRCKEKY